MSTPHATFETEGPLAFLTFNRPEARNAMSWDMYQALADACATVDADAGLRVLILRAAGGRGFVSGTDISQFTDFRTAADGVAYERRLDEIVARLECVTRPTIAQVHGVAAGAGCIIALACDLRVCTPDARFGVPIARTLGNCLSAANCARLLDSFGPGRIKDVMFTGRLLEADEANALGLITRLVEPVDLDGAVRELAQTIAANAPLTIRVTKEMVRRIQEHRRLGPDAARDLIELCYASEDFKAGVSAFLARRPPRWQGR